MKPRNDRSNLTSRHRLRGEDYSLPGYYFLTFATHEFQMLFGKVVDDQMILTPAGKLLNGILMKLETEFPTLSLDIHAVMPNHVHLLIYQNLENSVITASDSVRWVKGQSLAGYRSGVKDSGWSPFNGKLWMAGFHDEILRTERQLENVRRYIRENPQRWDEDEFRSMKDVGGFRR